MAPPQTGIKSPTSAGSGRGWARLDCAAHNDRLRRYYADADAGYREMRQVPRPGRYEVALFEKQL